MDQSDADTIIVVAEPKKKFGLTVLEFTFEGGTEAERMTALDTIRAKIGEKYDVRLAQPGWEFTGRNNRIPFRRIERIHMAKRDAE